MFNNRILPPVAAGANGWEYCVGITIGEKDGTFSYRGT